jgi:hypothetical protein
MEWLWLLLFLVLLGALWLAIKGVDWLTEYTKEKSRIVKEGTETIAEVTEKEEQEFLRRQENKAKFDKVLTQGDKEKFSEVLNNLSLSEFGDIVFEKVFDNKAEENKKSVIAAKSAFAKQIETKAVAKGGGIMPIFAKKPKGALSKEEQKIYEKVKKGY